MCIRDRSGTAYIFANVLGDNKDLCGLALVGAIGDKQKMIGGNAEILKEGIESGYISLKKGLTLHSMKIRDALIYSLEPYLDFYGNEEELEEFLKKCGIEDLKGKTVKENAEILKKILKKTWIISNS